MIRATSVLPAGSWTGTVADIVLLDFEARHRRRLAMSGRGGVSFLLDLPIAMALHPGDGLVLEDGRIVAVEAATERLVDVSADSAPRLARIAWHIGCRYLPTQFLGDHLRIRPDSELEAFLAGLGATLLRLDAPFDPETAPHVDFDPWSSFWQGFDGKTFDDPAVDSSRFAQGGGSAEAGERAEGWSSFYRTGPAFSKAHGQSFSTGRASGGRTRQSHAWSESHAQSSGQQHTGPGRHDGARRTRGEGGDPNSDDPSSQQS